MSRIKPKDQKEGHPSSGFPISQGTRIDPAHHGQSDPESSASSGVVEKNEPRPVEFDEDAAHEIPPLSIADEQLQRQAEQLAEYLRGRQQELDHRENQIHAQWAQLETDARTARIWLGERESELNERERQIDVLERRLRHRLDRLASAEAVWERRIPSKENDRSSSSPSSPQVAQDPSTPEEESLNQELRATLRDVSSTWNRQSQHLSSQAARQAALGSDLMGQERRLKRQSDEIASKQLALEQAEQRLTEAREEIRRLQDQLLQERQAIQEEARSQRQRLATEQRQAMAELEKRRETVEHREEHVEQCRSGLVQLRAELHRMHRETLEVRLATEELWAQLSGVAPPAALTRSLGRIRTQLADHYRQANAELLEQKNELESIRSKLAEHYEKFISQKRQFEEWVTHRRQEVEEQSSRLIAREQELQELELRFLEQSRHWEMEQREYQQEIRRLRLQVGSHEGSAKVA